MRERRGRGGEGEEGDELDDWIECAIGDEQIEGRDEEQSIAKSKRHKDHP
jgi:hypothetical protein